MAQHLKPIVVSVLLLHRCVCCPTSCWCDVYCSGRINGFTVTAVVQWQSLMTSRFLAGFFSPANNYGSGSGVGAWYRLPSLVVWGRGVGGGGVTELPSYILYNRHVQLVITATGLETGDQEMRIKELITCKTLDIKMLSSDQRVKPSY